MKTLAQARDKAEIVERLRTLRPDSARQWGRMSVHQMVCHLNDSFRVAIGRRTFSDVSNPLRRTIVKWVALYLPLRWPPGIATVPEVDQESGGTRPVAFAADLAELEQLVELITTRTTDFAWAPRHPIFGGMTKTEWLRWSYLHADHHLRQFGA